MHSKPGLRHYCRHDAGPHRPGRLAGRHCPRGRPGLVRREHGGQGRRDEPRGAGDQRRARIPDRAAADPARFARAARFPRSGRVGQPGREPAGPERRDEQPVALGNDVGNAVGDAAAGTVRSYTLDGGRVALDVSGDSAALVTAMPDAGFSVQTWSGTDWLRVDFSSGAQVSSLIASWYQHAPTVTVEN